MSKRESKLSGFLIILGIIAILLLISSFLFSSTGIIIQRVLAGVLIVYIIIGVSK